MWAVDVHNIIRNKNYHTRVDTEAEAIAWLNERIEKGSFGKGISYVVKGVQPYDERLVDSEEIVTDDLSGHTWTKVKLNPEYTYTISEIDEAGTSAISKQIRLDKAVAVASAFKPHVEFGQLVQLYFIGLVNLRSFNDAQKSAVIDSPTIREIIKQLTFGRIAKAKTLIDQLSADNVTLFPEDLLAVKTLINDFLDGL